MRLIDEAGRDGRGVLGRTAEQVQRAVGPLEVAVDVQVGQPVLQRLKASDDPAELHPGQRVPHSQLQRPPRRPVVSDLIIW